MNLFQSKIAAPFLVLCGMICGAGSNLGAPAVVLDGTDTVTVSSAMAVASGSFYRTGFFGVDPVERSLVTEAFVPPEPGTVLVRNDGRTVKWNVITADDKGWFHGDALRGGYVYVRVHRDRPGTVLVQAMSHQMMWVNGVPRVGNRYQSKEAFADWEPKFNFYLIPVRLKKGRNDFLFRCNRGRLKVSFLPVSERLFLNVRDATLPDAIAGEPLNSSAAVVVVNATNKVRDDLFLSVTNAQGLTRTQKLPRVPAMMVRKVPFEVEGTPVTDQDALNFRLLLFESERKVKRLLDTAEIRLRVVRPGEPQKKTFVSTIDGSVQYYAVNPAQDTKPGEKQALVLSLHGAGVEAINQASSYAPKRRTTIVCPTNRRPFGFDWEDWGRMDMLEVLNLAKREFPVDESRIYLTGHSMGGHGTWINGALYPDAFAAIAPSAGWVSWWTYGFREKGKGDPEVVNILSRAALPMRTFSLMRNYNGLGIYILHGSDDDNVPPGESRRMVDSLALFHHDFEYFEQPGAGHWWDISDEPGADCVDWPPIFDFFARHRRPAPDEIRTVDFTTPNPGVSATRYWLTIEQQTTPLELSHAKIRFDPGRNRFSGTTENIQRLKLSLQQSDPDRPLVIDLDSQQLKVPPDPLRSSLFLEKRDAGWSVAGPPDPQMKHPGRYGMFKDAFRNRMLFVIGTHGSAAENEWAAEKARYDAEIFWYQGNGSVEIMTDREFNPHDYPDRNIILYGNKKTNSAWKVLLDNSPVQVTRGEVTVQGRKFSGDDLAVFFIYPRRDSEIASIGVVAGTGIAGMKLTWNRPYLYAGFGLPDLVVFDSGILEKETGGVRVAGFFGNDWSVEHGDFVIK